MAALPGKHSSGFLMATEEEDGERTRGKEIWRMRCGQHKYSWSKMEAAAQNCAEDGKEWSVV